MKNGFKPYLIYVCFVFGVLLGSPAYAFTCTDVQFSVPNTWNKQTFFMGRDMPVGYVVSDGTNQGNISRLASCTGAPFEPMQVTTTTTSPFPVSTYNGGVFTAADGNTYPLYQVTPYLAYGLAILKLGTPPTLANDGTYVGATFINILVTPYLVITDVVQPGVVDLSAAVVVNVQFGGMSTNVSMTGALTFNQATCQTNDVTVNLGNHKAAEFSGVGYGTNWTDFAINLQNCPAFAGPGAFGTHTSRTPNTIGVMFTPTTPVIGPPTNGTIALSTNPSGPTASGIAIQVANAVDSAPVTIDSATVNAAFNPAVNSAAGDSYTIPFKARYVQTDANISGGKANGALLFTINYQ